MGRVLRRIACQQINLHASAELSCEISNVGDSADKRREHSSRILSVDDDSQIEVRSQSHD